MEDVEIVRGLYEAFERRDNESPFEVFDSDIVWDGRKIAGVMGRLTGLAEIFHGHEGVRRFWSSWLEAWEEIEFEYEVLPLPDGRVVGLVTRQRNKGRGSGIWVDQGAYAQIWTLRDGKVVKMEYTSTEEARGLAAGEQPKT